jgi:hypothetical protein
MLISLTRKPARNGEGSCRALRFGACACDRKKKKTHLKSGPRVGRRLIDPSNSKEGRIDAMADDALVKSGLLLSSLAPFRVEQQEYSILPSWELEAHATCDSDTCGVFHSPME